MPTDSRTAIYTAQNSLNMSNLPSKLSMEIYSILIKTYMVGRGVWAAPSDSCLD